MACGICVNAEIRWALPWIDAVIVVLLLWRLAWLVVQVRLGILGSRWWLWLPGRVVGLVLAGAYMGYLPVMIWLVLGIYRAIRDTIIAGGGRLWILHGLALAIVLPLMLREEVISGRLDRLDRMARYVPAGTGLSRRLAIELGKQPDFDVKQLIPLLESEDFNHRELAFEFLMRRKKMDDLLALREVVLAIPRLEVTFNQPDGEGSTYGPLWFSGLFDEPPKSKEELRQLIERELAKGEAAATTE
jgi:hypothetical protein